MTAFRQAALGLGLALSSLSFAFAALLLAGAEERLQRSIRSDCAPPSDWVAYRLQAGETIEAVAVRSGLGVDAILQANCISGTVLEGEEIFLPAAVEPSEACGPPEGWALGELGAGQSLASVAASLGTTESVIRAANCLTNESSLQPGMRLYFPPSAAPTTTPTPTQAPTATPDAAGPTATPILSPTP